MYSWKVEDSGKLHRALLPTVPLFVPVFRRPASASSLPTFRGFLRSRSRTPRDGLGNSIQKGASAGIDLQPHVPLQVVVSRTTCPEDCRRRGAAAGRRPHRRGPRQHAIGLFPESSLAMRCSRR